MIGDHGNYDMQSLMLSMKFDLMQRFTNLSLSFCPLLLTESGKLDEAAAINPAEEPTIGAEGGAYSNGDVLLDDMDIDEDLFGAEADIDNELEELDLED